MSTIPIEDTLRSADEFIQAAWMAAKAIDDEASSDALKGVLEVAQDKVRAAIQALEEMRGAAPMSEDRITSLLIKGAVDGGYDVLGLSKDAPPPKEA